MYVTLPSSTCFGPWHAHPQEEQLYKHSIWYLHSHKRLYTTPFESSLLSTGVMYSRLWERGYQMLCLCSCSSWGWARQGPKHVEDSSVTYLLLLKCALKLVEEIILYYDARSKKHQTTNAHFTNMFNHTLLFVANTFRSLLWPPSVCLIKTIQSTYKLHAWFWLYLCYTTAWWWSSVWPTGVGKE